MPSKMTHTIKLNRLWHYGPELDSGGFGRVYQARADDGSIAVVKLIPKAPGASRELLFEEHSGSPNIIPILDSGEVADHYVLVMPLAEKSLRKHLDEAGGKLDIDQAIAVLSDAAEVSGRLPRQAPAIPDRARRRSIRNWNHRRVPSVR